MGTRGIRASIADDDFDEKIYGSKKVSRAQREEAINSSEDQSDDEEGEMEMEEGESEMDDLSSIEDLKLK